MQLFIYCGGRHSDVVALGRQHTRNGRLRYTQNKNGRRKPVVVDIAMPAELQKVIGASQAAGITGDLTFLVTEYGRSFRAAGSGNKFGSGPAGAATQNGRSGNECVSGSTRDRVSRPTSY
jgi:hypothetical protein